LVWRSTRSRTLPHRAVARQELIPEPPSAGPSTIRSASSYRPPPAGPAGIAATVCHDAVNGRGIVGHRYRRLEDSSAWSRVRRPPYVQHGLSMASAGRWPYLAKSPKSRWLAHPPPVSRWACCPGPIRTPARTCARGHDADQPERHRFPMLSESADASERCDQEKRKIKVCPGESRTTRERATTSQNGDGQQGRQHHRGGAATGSLVISSVVRPRPRRPSSKRGTATIVPACPKWADDGSRAYRAECAGDDRGRRRIRVVQ
jgi:hypothetical protein